MPKEIKKNTILILGASGFIGNVLYKELLPYFDVFGTYCSKNEFFEQNKVFFRFCVEKDSVTKILSEVKPTYIISCILGDFKSQLKAHQEICEYVKANHESRLLYLSSAKIFDGKSKFPSYENNKPLAESAYGKFKISVEKMLLYDIPAQTVILRLPIILGANSPKIFQLQQSIKNHATFEIFPNLIISVTTANKIAQQVHYIINKNLDGIFHLASTDMIHHEDLFIEITSKIGEKLPIFKSTYTSNDDSYLAILPKINKLPEAYNITVAEVVEACTLNEEILTFKN